MKSKDVPFLAKDAEMVEAAPDANDGDLCAVEGCDNAKADGSEWCKMHTRRLSRHQAEAEASDE